MAPSASPIVVFNKDPLEVLDYTLNWKPWLKGDRLTSVTWTMPAGVANAGDVYSASTTTIFITGGTAGTSYAVYVVVGTARGRTAKRTIQLNVVDR
jgi:hypothetical protein